MLYNFAPRYREAIFRAIDERWDTEWFFGVNSTDIKGLDLGVLRRCSLLPVKQLPGHWYWQKGAVALAGRPFSTYFVLGEPYCASTWLLALRLKLFSRSKKLYFWTHGWYGKESRVVRLIKKAFFKLADGVFLYGDYAKGLMAAEGFDESKLFVIHNSLHYSEQLALRKSIMPSDVYRSHFGNDNPTLIFIGRLTAVKKLDQLIEAAAKLRNGGMPVNVVFVGDGAEADSLKALAEERGLGGSCWFYGACYDERRNAELIFNADLCVAPGNVGLTAMHAMVFGTPVVSHNDFKWQMPEFEAIKEGVTGSFFQRDNVDNLASAIKAWLTANTDREKVRAACYAEIDSYWTPAFQMSVLEKHLKV